VARRRRAGDDAAARDSWRRYLSAFALFYYDSDFVLLIVLDKGGAWNYTCGIANIHDR
jgi:hypothetical protein